MGTAEFAQEAQTSGHPGCAGFILCTERGSPIKEIQLNQIKSPLIEYAVKDVPEILLDFRMIDIQRAESGPIASAEPFLTVYFQEPVRMIQEQAALGFCNKGRQPQASLESSFMDCIGNG